jgi:AcrR family transcriptional regulator
VTEGDVRGDTGSRGQRMRAADRRSQLLEVATRILSNPATTNASMDEIAAAAGVTKPVLYRHFPSKRELVRTVLAQGIERLNTTLNEAAAEATTPKEYVEKGFLAFFKFIEAEPGAYQLLFGNGTWTQSGFFEELDAFQTAAADRVSLLIDVPGMDPGIRRILGGAIIGMCDHAARQWLRAGFEPSAEEAAAELVSLAWAGLRGLQPRA